MFDIDSVQNTARRRVEHTYTVEHRDGRDVRLTMNVSHDEKGDYLVTLWREWFDGTFVKVSIMEDSLRSYNHKETRGARYSAKKLEELAAEKLAEFRTMLEAGEVIEWARGIKWH